MRSEIRRICSETKITTVYVTHDQKEALSMADNMAVLRAGKVAQVGPPRQLYDRPASRFVADFLGETNFIPATVVESAGGRVVLETAAGRLVSKAGDANTPRGGNVTLSIRPEAWRMIDAAAGSKCDNIVSGKLSHTTFLGEMAQHQMALADGQTVRIIEMNPSMASSDNKAVHLSVDGDDIVILVD